MACDRNLARTIPEFRRTRVGFDVAIPLLMFGIFPQLFWMVGPAGLQTRVAVPAEIRKIGGNRKISGETVRISGGSSRISKEIRGYQEEIRGGLPIG